MAKLIVKMPPRFLKKDPNQAELSLEVARQVEDAGIGMGVLNDGTPFLNQRGLALLCGVQNKYIGELTAEWAENQTERVKKIRAALTEGGHDVAIAAYDTRHGNVRVLAYPDVVCMAILEYFAFDANRAGQQTAAINYRKLARHGLRKFIYERVGYTPETTGDVWKIFHDRVSLTYDSVPSGYFSVFKELSSLIVTLGLSGLHIDQNFVPDISVGQAWSRHWNENRLTEKYGMKETYPHSYPAYFPQSASNPQIANCYPEDALGEFRRWFRKDYIGEGRFRKYLTKKVTERLLPDGYVERAMLALTKED